MRSSSPALFNHLVTCFVYANNERVTRCENASILTNQEQAVRRNLTKIRSVVERRPLVSIDLPIRTLDRKCHLRVNDRGLYTDGFSDLLFCIGQLIF